MEPVKESDRPTRYLHAVKKLKCGNLVRTNGHSPEAIRRPTKVIFVQCRPLNFKKRPTCTSSKLDPISALGWLMRMGGGEGTLDGGRG